MTYLELLQALEHRLGYQHLPLNPCASNLKNIFECSPVHHDLIHRLVRALYQTNTCRKLTDTITRDACFAAIGPVRQEVLKTPTTDVDAYQLLENLCHALDDIFGAERAPAAVEEKKSADVIHLDAVRRRKMF